MTYKAWLSSMFGAALGLAVGSCTADDGSKGGSGTDDDDGGTGACTVGTEGCPCTGGGACDPGLECLSDVCVDPGGGGTGGDGDSSGSGGGGSGTSGTESGGGTGTGGSTGDGGSDDGSSGDGGTGSTTTPGAGSGSTDSTGDGSGGTDTPSATETTGETTGTGGFLGCEAVDILFVIDSSTSMADYQNALGLAFPQFADEIVSVLPPGTNVHVGVTSTQMGYSASGSTYNCTSMGDGGQPADAFYVTPDVMDTGINGAQGRLYDPGAAGGPFFSVDTNAAPADIQALKNWFTQAAAIGEGGSNVEMASAPAGWAFDPANAIPNAGFLRDEGAVLVLFFLQDEPDQTPLMIDGKTGGQAMLDKLAAAKSMCGGTECIVGGGFVNEGCLPMTPLGELLDGLGAAPVTAALPAAGDPQAVADEMATLLRNTLASAIAQKCEEIPPPN